MLIEFTVANYLSFKEPVTLTMLASNYREFQDTHVFNYKNFKLLKSAAIYGANASGKSNLCKAMAFMADFIQTSSKETQIGEKIDITPFLLNTSCEKRPSEFEIVFFLNDNLYRYGFHITDKRIVKEWLYYVPKKSEKLLFERSNDNFKLSPEFKEGKEWIEHTRENALFLSVIAQWKGSISTHIVQWITNNFKVVSGLNITSDESIMMLSNSHFKDKFIEFLKAADFGIEDLDVNTRDMSEAILSLPKAVQNLIVHKKIFLNLSTVNLLHKKFNENNQLVSLEKFDLMKQESMGTRKLFSILAPIISAVQQQTTLVIDELDSSLHPHLTQKIIEIFNSESNKFNSQLVFNTHDTNLLSNKIFRRDQIWFVEKDRCGASHLYSLAEYKDIRSDEAYEKNYLKGKYGAIPYFGEFDFLVNNNEEISNG